MTRKRFDKRDSPTQSLEQKIAQAAEKIVSEHHLDAFDQLPLAVRTAIAEAKTAISPVRLLDVMKQWQQEGHALDDLAEVVRRADQIQLSKRAGHS